jgi:two-component system response regulator NreC
MLTKKIRVILIDDHSIVRAGLKLLLRDDPDIEVVGDAANGRDGIRLFERISRGEMPGGPIDVVVTDLSMPDIGGMEVIRQVRRLRPEVRILILSMHSDDEYIQALFDLGADGYLLKQAAPNELAEAIHTIARGEMALSPSITRRLMTKMHNQRNNQKVAMLLSERERQVLNLMATGITSKELAHELGLSTKTVENHRSRILSKLGVANTAAAINVAAQKGLLTPQGEKNS